jgi:hypothetical protein
MFAYLTELVATYRLGDFASIIGLLVAIVGFAITLWNVVRSKRAAENAEEAVRRMRELLVQANTIKEFSAALGIMDEIRRLHRAAAWPMLPDRYSALKRSLIAVRAANPTMSERHKTVTQAAITHFTAMERTIEAMLANQSAPPNVARLNQIVSRQLDSLAEVLVEIQDQIGR